MTRPSNAALALLLREAGTMERKHLQHFAQTKWDAAADALEAGTVRSLEAAREAVLQAAKAWAEAWGVSPTDRVDADLDAAVRALIALEVSPAPEKSP